MGGWFDSLSVCYHGFLKNAIEVVSTLSINKEGLCHVRTNSCCAKMAILQTLWRGNAFCGFKKYHLFCGLL